MKILALETSCDETAAAVVENGTKILSNIVASSNAMHEKYGGIVPEVAAREQLKCILPVITEALAQAKADYKSIDSLAVTVGPGLIGSLLVGVETAKTIAFVTGKPIITVNHVIAHMYANFVEIDQSQQNSSRGHSAELSRSPQSRDNLKTIEFPAISLVVSGGHTELFLMESLKKLSWLGGTLDDAAGEAFDKTARLLGFGHGGGPAIQEAAAKFETRNSKLETKLPRPMINDESLNFSFSGLKTAIVREWKRYPHHGETLINEFTHEVQEAITDVLVIKTLRAVGKHKAKSILVSGGVAANLKLRGKFQSTITNHQLPISLFLPPVSLCTDNAVYIAACAFFRGKSVNWRKITALPDLSVEENI